jgi:hypothetical protein
MGRPPATGESDLSHLGLRMGHRGYNLRDAVPLAVAGELNDSLERSDGWLGRETGDKH